MPDPNDLSAAILQAATERAQRGPFNPDGTLTDEARADVQAILDQADDLDGLSAALGKEAGG
jgi:hypothetical protein